MRSIPVTLLACAALVAGCAAPPAATVPPPVVVAGALPVTYRGGDGTSSEQAVVVVASDEATGVRAEYQWLREHHPGYRRGTQSLTPPRDGRRYDVIAITRADGTPMTIHFDITSFFGK